MWWGLALWGGLILSGVLVVCAIIAGALELYDKRTVFVREPLLHDKSGAIHGRLRSALDIGLQLGVILLRLAVIAYAGFWLWTFHLLFWFALHRLGTNVIGVFIPSGTNVRPIALFTILIGGIIGPGFAVAAIMLAAANKYLVLALLAMAGTYLSVMMSCC
jgi:hypothetical protein